MVAKYQRAFSLTFAALTLVARLPAQDDSPPVQNTAYLVPAPLTHLPEVIDGNSAAFWTDGRLHLLHSSGVPSISEGSDQFSLSEAKPLRFETQNHTPVWFEAAWRDDDGTVLLWYHHEPGGLCGKDNSLTAPKIGAAVSYDGGRTVKDLGIVLESAEPIDCNARNGFFGGGHGDFSVVLDQTREFFYFFFTNYGGPLASQGVAVARLAFDDRYRPAGAALKYHDGRWEESGIGGRVTPVFPAIAPWEIAATDSFWGPSIHWNTRLQSYVVLLNRACCRPGWPQQGIYISFNPNLANPSGWQEPALLLDGPRIGHRPGYYPQVIGLEPGETDSVAGVVARFYVHGMSRWEIVFGQAPVRTDDGPCMTTESSQAQDQCEPGDSPLKTQPSYR